ncbi:MAG: SulP family inorganic anion transporter, partial [Chlamydiia bacterium]|nr:SulP family inorganic anion transporter [Chlamydiia bacterium]
DAMAGFTVALLAVPQAMAYALVAGLPLSAGLLSAFIGVIFGASFGSSRHLVMGPTNAIAILIQAATADILYTHFRGLEGLERELMAGEIVIQITLLIGILQLLASGLGLGRLVQFVSRSVVVGYVNGAALAIFVGQLFVACGIQKQEGGQAVWAQLCAFVLQLKALHLPTLVVTCASLFLLAALRRTHWRVPPTVLMLGIVSGVLLLLGGSSWGVRMVGDYGTLDQVLPSIHFPVLRMRYLNEVLPHAFAIALLGILEATSAAKAVSLRSGRRFQINQEIFGLGVCNLFSAGIGAMPAYGSASRSFLNFHSGARTRCAAVFSGLWVGVIWALLGGVVVYIPLAALSAILFLTAATMVDWSQLRLCLRATGADAAVLLVTTTAAVFMSLDVAFYTGVMLSLALYLREASIPRFLEHPMPVLN